MAETMSTGDRPINTRKLWTGGGVVAWLATPRPAQFFGWIMVLATLIAALLPLTLDVDAHERVGTALLNLTIGLVITGLVSGVARVARTPDRRPESPSRP